MLRTLSAAVLVALAFPAPRAAADVLTCAAFRTRLDQTIADMGETIAHPGPLIQAYDAGETGKRFDWQGIVGLSGTMNCGQGDAFQDFGITIGEAYRTSDDLPAVLKRFVELASASVCTLSEAAPTACRALAQSMTLDSLAQFKAALGKSEAMPTGTRDFFIVPGVDAELDMTPVGISWSIGPGLSASMDAARRKLTPKNADE